MNHQIARMAFSQAFQLLRITGIAFVILPYFSLGLLSDYKICGDSECESLMSRVQAIRDHHGKDCRFLNFRQGDTIFVYHKLMGKREDLWAGTIDKQFGYFPKDAVQEEQVYATMEKVVQTQKSDFICMNEFGYPIDSSHLDSDDDDNNQKIPNEESKTTQTDQCTDDTSAESPSASVNPFTESPVSAQQSDGTSIEEGENKNAADAPGRIHKEVQETPAVLIEQGGSPSSSWLGSSVTGWLGLEQEEQPANLAEGGGKGEIKERQAETSSMMGWLGFGGGEGNPNDAVKNREKHKEAANSLTSTMTRWLGFGGEKRTVFTKKEQDEEREIDEESDLKETFRSRRMSLDLEGSQLHEEEKEKTGTLDWLGNGLSSVLGFGMTNQGLGHKTISGQKAEETIEEKKEQPVSNSWLNIGIRDILGFRNDKTEVDESKVSGSNDKEKDTTLEAATGTENVDTSQSQPAQTTEPDIQSLEEQLGLDTIPEGEDNYISNFIKDSNKLNVEDKDQVLQYNTEPESASLSLVKEDTNNNNIDASHWSKDSSLPIDAASKVDQEDISPQAKLEEESQGVGGTYEERLAETEIEGYQMPQIIGKDDEDNTAPVEEKIKSTSDTVHDFLTRTHNSMGRFVSKAEEDDKDQPQSKKTGSVNEEGARITNHIEDTEDSTVLIGASNEEYARERSTVDTDALHRDISTAQLDESAEHSQVSDNAEESSGKSKPPFSSGSANERNEPTHSVKPDVHNSDILAMTDNNKETETHHAELVENGRAHTLESRSQEFRSSHSTNRSAPSPYEMFSEVVTLTQDTNMDNTDQDSASLQLEQRIIQDAVDQLGETKKKGKKIPQQAHSNKEKLEFEKEILNDVSQKSAIRSEIETETEEVEELQEEVKRDELKEVEESKEGDKQQKLDEEKQEKVDEIMEEKKQEEVDTLKERQQEAEDVKEKQEEVEELKEEEEQEQVEKVSKDETGEEVEEVKEQEKQEQLDKAKKEDKKEEVGALKDDKYDEVEEFKEEENVEEIEEEKKQEKADELQEEERQAKVEEFKDEKKLEEMEDLKEVEMQQKIAELKEEERQAEVEVLKEEKMQEEVQKLKEVEKQEEFKEVHGLKEKETEEGKEKHLQSLHLEVQKKNTHDIGKAEPVRNEKETQDEKPKMERMQTGKEKKEEEKTNQEMVEEVKAETKQVEEMQQVNDVEGEWWDKEEEESLKCSHELCPQAESESVRDRDEKISEDGPCSGAEATIQTGKQNYEILENGTRESQTTPTDGMEGDRGREEETKTISNVASADEVEKRNCKSNPTWNEDISNNANDISDPIGLDIDQIGATKCTVSDPQLADEDGHSGSSTRDSAESQAEKTLTHVSQDPASSTDPSGLVQNESPGAFGLFKNAFSFFSKRPFSETKETTESAPCLETSTGETSKVQASLTPEQELDSTTDLIQYMHKGSLTMPTQQHTQPSPPSTEIHSHLNTLSPNIESPLQTKTISKHYKNLLIHMSTDEVTILMELFGRHKLQFLDYILGNSESVTDPDHDESILSDIERLLHHHGETLITPSMRQIDALQEDREKSRTLIALQELEMLLGRVRKTFITGEIDDSKVNHQGIFVYNASKITDASMLVF